MKKTYCKDIWRSIKKSKKRFLSIVAITAMGVAVLTGIYAACMDMFQSADSFYDKQHLYDIRILSTLGLTEKDVEALKQVPDIEMITGAYSETVYTDVDGSAKDAEVSVLREQGINMPYILQGELPSKSGEVAVTKAYLDDTGKSVGDTVTIVEKLGEKQDESDVDAESKAEKKNEEQKPDDALEWDTSLETIEVEEEEEATFPTTSFTICGIVADPMDISNKSLNFRSSSAPDYSFFISEADAIYDIYTSIYITIKGFAEMDTYSSEYEANVRVVMSRIENEIMRQRELARYNEVLKEARAKITDAKVKMDGEFAKADQKFEDAWDELKDAKQELTGGQADLTREEKEALQKIADAYVEIENGKAQLRAGESELRTAEAELAANEQRLAQGKQALLQEKQKTEAAFVEAERIFTEKQNELDIEISGITAGIEQLKLPFGAAWPQTEWDVLVTAAANKTVEMLTVNPEAEPDPSVVAAATLAEQNTLAVVLGPIITSWGNPEIVPEALIGECIQAGIGMGILQGGQQTLDAQRTVYEQQKADAIKKFADAEAEIIAGEIQLEAGKKQLSEARAAINSGWAALAAGEQELKEEESKALREISNAWQEIAKGKQELADGEEELIENEQIYEEKRIEAEQKLAEAYDKLQEIDMAEWYVQDRTALESYSSLKIDMSSIQAIGKVFPIIFLVVAVLISLTTMTRMVEEERGLIGTYKALGMSDAAIYAKYLAYAFIACLMGGILGDLLGFIALPIILINILQVMYTMPQIQLGFDALYGIGGILLFVVFIVASTALACRKELRQMPATLMRPKAPKAGARIALERVPFIWNRLGFLNKVTARNLFRYKKRLFMTLIGIMGCTALVLTGLAIRDSVEELVPAQYERIYKYDMMVVTDEEDNSTWVEEVKENDNITSFLNLQTDSFKLLGADGASENVQLMVVPNGESINGYVSMQDKNGQPVTLDNSGLFVTQNAANLLGLQVGESTVIQSMQLDQREAVVAEVVQNYLGNNVYMTQDLYEALFGEYKPNAILVHLADTVENKAAYAESFLSRDFVLSSVSIEAMKADFSSNFTLMNSVVYILVFLAAGLAFVVLFTLSNTNISERIRELATIKVLGFFDNEVHSYVNKETMILTLIGVGLGLPVGRFVSGLLTSALKISSLHFAVHVNPVSYLIAAVLSLCFALIVNAITNRTLDKINMVEALKSVE